MITVHINTDSIYEHSSVAITLKAESPFSAQLSGEIIAISSGKRNPKQSVIHATKRDDSYEIKVELLHWLTERTVRHSDGAVPHNKYGMRFYPFVSSFVSGTITTYELPINVIILELPDDYRLIWYGAKVSSPNGKTAKLDHAYGPQRSKYLFTWPEENNLKGEYGIKIPVRLGGSMILRLVEFPIFYWFLALVGVAIAARQNNPSILIAAVVGVWTFMLRQWGASNLPQRTTILTRGYILAGTFVLLWALVWWNSQSLGFILSVPVLVLTLLIYRSLSKFGYEGLLPPKIEKYWSKQIAKIDKKQSSVWSR